MYEAVLEFLLVSTHICSGHRVYSYMGTKKEFPDIYRIYFVFTFDGI